MNARANPTAYATVRRDLIAACRHLSTQGLSPGSSGNVSILLGDRLLVTPTGSSLHRVQEADLVVVPVDAAELGGAAPNAQGKCGPEPARRASKETPLHLAIYRECPDARAVVHLHSPFATAVSCLEPDANGDAPLDVLTAYHAMRFGRIPICPFAPPGTLELSEGVRRLASASHAILLANHGCVVAGRSLNEATDLAEELEAAAQLHFLLRGSRFNALSAI